MAEGGGLVMVNGRKEDKEVKKRIEFHPARKPFLGIIGGNSDNNYNNSNFRIETLNPPNISSNKGVVVTSNLTTMKSKKSEGLEKNVLDQELTFQITFRRIGAGLENLGNTCFLNSVLQCLTYTEPLAAYLQSGKHQNSCHIAGFCALCAIQKHVSRALQATGRILAPKDLVSNLRCISRSFRNSRQEDAHEYMVNLLESMHKCCLPSGVPSESPGAYEKSLVHNIFGGRLRSQVKCMQCSYCSNKFDPFIDLSLEIAKADSVHKALVHFTSAEQLDGGERQYQCQRCKQKVRALKQLTVYKAPNVLTIHLKRFSAHDPGKKIDKKVMFGPTLDLKPFVSGPNEEDLKYTLYGVLVHAGWSTHSGHYYCFVRTSSGMWYSLDDNRVVQVSERTVLEQKAYMLFYVRDRKNVASKKPFSVYGENKAMNAMQNKMPTTPVQGFKGVVQNGLKRKQLSDAAPSSCITQNDVCNKDLKSEAQSREPSVLKIKGPTAAEDIVSKDIQPKPSKDPVDVVDPKVVESLPQTVPPALSSGEIPGHENTNLATFVKVSNKDKDSKRDLSVSIAIASEYNGQQNFNSIKPVTDKISQKPIDALNLGILGIASGELSGQAPDNQIPNNCGNVNNQVGGIQSEGTDADSANKKESDTGLKSSINGSMESQVSSVASSRCRPRDCELHRKSKKKLLKSSVASLRLGSNIMFRSLSLRKKKHKRNRWHSLQTGNINLELLEEIDSGPSTSDKTRVPSLGSTPSRKKRVKFCPKNRGKIDPAKEVEESNSDAGTSVIAGESTERVSQNDAELATDKLSEKSSNMKKDHSNSRLSEVSRENQRLSIQNDLMSVLTRGIEETSVSCWNGIELPLYQSIESRTVGSVKIGYVADEWDEEYDRGKRKKVRLTKDMFDGSNPFQEIATKKAQRKNAKMDRSSSGNRPFRI